MGLKRRSKYIEGVLSQLNGTCFFAERRKLGFKNI
jgi:hypothetical protein